MPLGSPAEEQEPSWEKKVLFGGCTGDVSPPPLLSSIFPAFSSPFLRRLLSDAGTAGRRSQSDEGEPGDGQLFFREEFLRSPVYISLTLSPAVNLLTSGLDSFFFLGP